MTVISVPYDGSELGQPLGGRGKAKTAEARMDEDIMASIDDVLGDIIERDPAKAGRPYDVMARWRAPETA